MRFLHSGSNRPFFQLANQQKVKNRISGPGVNNLSTGVLRRTLIELSPKRTEIYKALSSTLYVIIC